MKSNLYFVIVLLALFPVSALADCADGKRSIQELVYEEKADLISAYCVNHATYLGKYGYVMALLNLGDTSSSKFQEADRAYKACTSENTLIRKVLKKDHEYEFKRETDCPEWLDTYEQISESYK